MGTVAQVSLFVVSTLVFAWLARRLLGAERVTWLRAILAGVAGCMVGGAEWWWMIRVDVDDDTSALVGGITAVLVTMGVIVALQLVSVRPVDRSRRLGPAGSLRVARRTTEIASIAARNGLGPFIGRRGSTSVTPLAARIRETLEESGVVFVKFGQLLAGRPDLVGAEIAAELTALQHRVKPLDRTVMEPALRATIPDFDAEFATIDWDPLGSASIAQVYSVRLTDGTDAVIKVRRPGIADEVRRDGQVIRLLAAKVERRSESARSIGLADLVEAFVADLEHELDYLDEARAAAELERTFEGTSVSIPAVRTSLISPDALVMDRIKGKPLAEADLDHLPDDVRHGLAVTVIGAHVGAMLDGGRFHADLHPGNVMITPEQGLAFIDFGATGVLGPSQQGALASLLMGLRLREPTLLRDSLVEVADSDGTVDTARLDRALAHLLSEHIRPGENLSSAAVVELLQVMRDHDLRLPASSSAMFRGLVTVLDSIEILSPGLAVLDHIDEISEIASPVPTSPKEFTELFRDEAAKLLPVLRRAPRLTDSVVNQLDRGDLSIRVRALSHPDDVRLLVRLVNRAVMAFVAIGLGVVSVMLFGLSTGPYISDEWSVYDALGSIGLLAGAVLVMRVVLETLDSDRP